MVSGKTERRQYHEEDFDYHSSIPDDAECAGDGWNVF